MYGIYPSAYNIVACQAHPALVKRSDVRTVSISLLVSRRGLEVWRFVGYPAPLARNNI